MYADLDALLAAYNAITAKTGFGLCNARDLLSAGATWALLYALTDAGLIRVERVDMLGNGASSVLYRLFFP